MREPYFLDLGTLGEQSTLQADLVAAAYVKGLQLGTVIQDGLQAHARETIAEQLQGA